MPPQEPHLDESDWQQAVYDSLHRIAEAALAKEANAQSLQPTLLVHDAWMRLRAQRNLESADRSQVLAAGATVIRRLLVDYARRRRAKKRGGSSARPLTLQVDVPDPNKELEVLELHEALNALARESSRAARIVELKFFGGLTGQEIADELDISLRTVNNDWKFAKAWLYRSLADNRIPEVGES